MIELIEKKIEEISKNYNIPAKDLKQEIAFDEFKLENKNKQKYRNTLVIEYVKIKGKKKNNIIFEEKFNFYKGVNVISTNGNNFRGKTTLLEIIKFLLTGKKDGIQTFATKIIKKYEMVVRVNFIKYKFEYDEANFKVNKIIDEDSLELIHEGDIKGAESYLSSFFSQQFNYHILKYTKSGKTSLDLSEATLNWKSYFGSIYLRDYNYLITQNNFGGLKSKIVQILFNLDYNKFINSLELKTSLYERELQKFNMLKSQKKYIKENEKTLEKQISSLEDELVNLNIILDDLLDFEKNEIISLKNELSQLKIKKIEISNNISELTEEIIILERRKIIKLQAEIVKKYLPNDYSCPLCQKEFSLEEKVKKIEEEICYICGEKHIYTKLNKENSIELKEKLEIELNQKKVKKSQLEKILIDLELRTEELEKIIKEKEQKELEKEEEIDKAYILLKQKKVELFDNKSKLEILEEFKKLDNEEKLLKIIGALKELIIYIKEKRYKNAEKKIDTFRTEFKEESIKIGIKGLDDIKFNEKDFDVIFYKNESKEGFNKLSDGEKLRVKIAFYLTWIQMSLKGDESVHPAFLMIDSPGKEETNEYDLGELSKIFYDLDTNEHEFQIIIASAKNLPNATRREKNKIYTDYLF